MDVYMFILKIAVVLSVGFIGAYIAKRFKLPNVSGYLVIGLLLGPSLGLIFSGYEGFITIAENDQLKFISEIALAFIAFSIGSEFALKSVKKMGKSVLVLTITEVVGAVLIVFLALLFIPKPAEVMLTYEPLTNANIAFGLILASMAVATAPAATLLVIREFRTYGPITKMILPITALDDVFGIIVFGFFISIAQLLLPQTAPLSFGLMVAKPFIEVIGSIVIGALVGFALSKLSNRFNKTKDDLQVLSLIAVFATIGGIQVLNFLLNDYGISFSQLLANMMVGAMLANLVKQPQKNFNAINDFSAPFYIIFFTLAGASLDLAILRQDTLILLIAVVYVIARAAGKILGIMTGAYIMKSPDTIKKYLGFALLPQGGISIGLLVVVYARANDLYPVISTVIMLSILVYETFGPVFAKLALSKGGELYGLDRLNELSDVDSIEAES